MPKPGPFSVEPGFPKFGWLVMLKNSPRNWNLMDSLMGKLRRMEASRLKTPSPRTIRDDVLAAEAVSLMEAYRITTLLVVDGQGVLVGAVNTNDLMRAKVI